MARGREIQKHVKCGYCAAVVDPRLHFNLDGTCPKRYGPLGEGQTLDCDDPSWTAKKSYTQRRAARAQERKRERKAQRNADARRTLH